MAGRVDDIDLMAAVVYRSVFAQDGNAAFTFQIVGVHNAVHGLLVLAVYAALLEHLVNQGCLAVVNVSDNCYISNIFPNHIFPFLLICWHRLIILNYEL